MMPFAKNFTTVVSMGDVKIRTSQKLTLSGDWILPVDHQHRAILFCHAFLRDRHNDGWFDLFAKSYRSQGWATLQLDLSGSGYSEDAPLTVQNQIEDLQSALTWLKDQGMKQVVIHTQGFGAVAALQVSSPLVSGYVLCTPMLGPMEIAWEEVFSEEQLHQLETQGYTLIPEDEHPQRKSFTITKQTLSDLTLIDTDQVITQLVKPTLFIADSDTLSMQWFEPFTKDRKLLLGQHCQLLVCPESSFIGPVSGQAKQIRLQVLEWLKKNFIS